MCRYAPSIALIGPKKTSPPQLLGRCCLNIDLFHPLPCRQAGVFLTDLYCMAAGGLPAAVLWLRRIWRRGTKRGARTPERAELGRVASLSPGLELERDRLRSGGQASLGDGAEGEDYAEHEHDIEFDAGQFPPLSAPLVTQYSVGGLRNSTEKYTIL